MRAKFAWLLEAQSLPSPMIPEQRYQWSEQGAGWRRLGDD
jgi:hypothetical protein